jgi:predicted Fe-Mo cluster-binding NifX family protein
MKIAVITDDSQTISAHFGRAQFYEIFTIRDGQIVQRETRSKANHDLFGGGDQHRHHGDSRGSDPASEHRHSLMIEPIRDCQVVLARGMGSGAFNRLASIGIRPWITEVVNIEEAVNAYLEGSLTDHPERVH